MAEKYKKKSGIRSINPMLDDFKKLKTGLPVAGAAGKTVLTKLKTALTKGLNKRANREFAKGASKKIKNQVKFWADLAIPSAAVIGTKVAVANKLDKDKDKDISRDSKSIGGLISGKPKLATKGWK
tara:strand:+ start:135 stop:512 length:378 start_codon:yes stop_codon:yes gene_type:complete